MAVVRQQLREVCKRFVLALSLCVPLSAAAAWGQEGATQVPPARLENTQEAPGNAEETLPPTTIVADPPAEGATPFPATPLNPQTLVTPDRSETGLRSVGSAVAVITADQITETRQTTVAEVLRGQLGIALVRSGGPGGATSVFLRGGNSEHTKVLLDGIPINDPSGPTRAFDFSTLTVDNIERIEVVRGPQSTLYGSDAIGGVINIITRRGEGPLTISTSSQGGSFGTARQAVSIQGGNKTYYYSLSGAYQHTDGISAATVTQGNSERDRYRNGTVSGRFGWTPSDTLAVDYVFRYVDAENEVDSFVFPFGFVDDPNRSNLNELFYNRLQLQSFALDGAVENKVGFSLTHSERGDTKPDFGPPRFVGLSQLVYFQSNLLLAEQNVLSVGVDYLQEEASTTFVTRRSQNNAAVYVQDRWELADRWYATAGARWDDHSAAGPASTYRLTSIVHFDGIGGALHGSLGTGFRAPALAQNFFTGGNPDLLPERSKGWDFGWRQQLAEGRLQLDVTWFRNDFRNLIDFDFNTFLVQNIGRARATGIEAGGTWAVTPSTSLSASYTLADTRDLEFGGKLARRPQQTARINLSRRFGDDRGLFNAYLLYIGDRLDLPQRFGGEVLDDYITLNVAGSWQCGAHCELFARIDNLLDEQYQEARNFGAPGIAFYGGLNLRF